ncbi:hypothetical protein GAGA_1009 [Paraglaciecola agarilytica NO2]|uniref:Uncharacterized protein n=1 Tax=Paraglaciecola agarilytica NO2 TaxID=1125747 RepID=A0ABQ0I3M1_9ALTE|nr:hypothetical protein GAGA_1009 [Paraglaciecola agarilytica NO2]
MPLAQLNIAATLYPIEASISKLTLLRNHGESLQAFAFSALN